LLPFCFHPISFFYNNSYIILKQQPFYKEVIKRRPDYIKVLQLDGEAATSKAMGETRPPVEGRRDVKDAYTRMD
jgi:hypothetical protein